MKKQVIIALATATLIPMHVSAKESAHTTVPDKVISEQRSMLGENTKDKGFGPQSPRDIDVLMGNNKRIFNPAPVSTKMNLCNIHFHKNAEHKGGEFTKYAGNGNGHGYQSGFKYSGKLNALELNLTGHGVCKNEHSSINSGDTIEVHYVYSTAQVKPGPSLASCFNYSIKNPQLRVETQVYVVVNDKNALDFGSLTKFGESNGLYQAVNTPSNTGAPVQYAGSTTGPGYNEKASPFQVTWSVRPNVAKVNIETVGHWCKGNVFNEDHGHGVRNLVMNPDLLSQIMH